MIRNVLIIFIFGLSLFADSSYDRTVEVLDSSRDEKVKQVFREMINAYQDEDARSFFEHVSEERFLQDYIGFSDAINQDFRYYDILQIDYFFDQIVPNGPVKRFLFVRWEKRFEDLASGQQLNIQGYSRFLFDEIEGDYKLIEVAGNNLWGDSVEEWTDEVPAIPGQLDEVSRADLVVQDIQCIVQNFADFQLEVIGYKIKNVGTQAMQTVPHISMLITPASINFNVEITNLDPGESFATSKAHVSTNPCSSFNLIVDPNNEIPESNNFNNTTRFN